MKFSSFCSLSQNYQTWPLDSEKFAKNQGKEGENQDKTTKNQEKEWKLGRFFHFCPSWQIGLAMLLFCRQFCFRMLILFFKKKKKKNEIAYKQWQHQHQHWGKKEGQEKIWGSIKFKNTHEVQKKNILILTLSNLV